MNIDRTHAWTIDELLEAESAGQRVKYLAFWGHTPPRDGAIGPHVFSQWFVHGFDVDGTHYPTAEHFMMAGKARLFGDDATLAAVLAAKTPGEAKKLGRLVKKFDADVWDRECLAIVRDGSVAKFGSTPELRSYLVGTGDRVLVEASPVDRIWGIGLARDHEDVERPSRWQGRNLLGFALMQARSVLAES